MMFVASLSLAMTFIVGFFSYLIYRQYSRVKKRDATRCRIQSYSSQKASSVSSSSYDPLDHSLYWYPVAFSHEITCDSGRPFGFYLLNIPLCLHRTNDGQITCVLDLCPHRSAPLSMGKITKQGNL